MWDTFKIFKFMVFVFSLTGPFLKAKFQGERDTFKTCMQLEEDDDTVSGEYELTIDHQSFSQCDNSRHQFLHIIQLRIFNGSCETHNPCFGPLNPGYMTLIQQVEMHIKRCILSERDSECDMTLMLPSSCSGNQLFLECNYSCPGVSTAATEITTRTNSDDNEITHEPGITDKIGGPTEDTDKEESSLSKGGKIAIAVVACVVALLLIILVVCLVRRNTKTRESKSSPRPDLAGAVNPVSDQSSAYINHIPEHVHYIPYDLLINPRLASQYEEIPDNQVTEKPQSLVLPTGDYAEIDGSSSGGYTALKTSQMIEDKTKMTENGAPKRDASYAIPNKLIQNVAYQGLDEYPRDNYDNAGHSYLKLSNDGEDLPRQNSVQRMVVNDV